VLFPTPYAGPKVKIGPQSTAELARAGYYNARIKKVEMGKINLNV